MLNLLKSRRSIRKYEPKPITDEEIGSVVQAALLSPSSRDLKPWEFVVVTDPGLLQQLARSKPHGSSFLKEAAAAIVVIADPAKCDVWIEDASIATLIIHLTAHSLNLGSCWIQIRNRSHNRDVTSEQYVSELLKIPYEYSVEAIVALGYPAEKKSPKGDKEMDYRKVHKNTFGNRYLV